MNYYAIGIVAALLGFEVIAGIFHLTYPQALLPSILIAAISAPIAIHKIQDAKWSLGLLVGLTLFASAPARRYYLRSYVDDNFLIYAAVCSVFFAALWVIGFGWKRDWSQLGKTNR